MGMICVVCSALMPLLAIVGLPMSPPLGPPVLLCSAWHCTGTEALMAWMFSVPVQDAVFTVENTLGLGSREVSARPVND